MSVRTNPPAWADEITGRFCETIKRAAKEHGLPLPLLDQCVVSESKTLGEGLYGLVLETEDDGCVFKITTDSTEAHFIATAIKLRRTKGVDPKGMVDFRAVFAIPAKRDDYPVFLVWRERALAVGLPDKPKTCQMETLIDLLQTFYKKSDAAFRIALDEQGAPQDDYWNWILESVVAANTTLEGGNSAAKSKFSDLLADCYAIADEIMDETGNTGFYVGEALRAYLAQGILLCDIHANNVGVVERGRCGAKTMVITDAGHALILKKDLAKIDIPVLKE